jgi:hypothetical protein
MKRAMTEQTDGGRRAIAGFVYQMVGLWGLSATGYSVVDDAGGTEDASDLERLLVLMRGATAEHETGDRDATLEWLTPEGEHASTIVQFKYSVLDPPRAIERTELRGIIDQLVRTSDRLETAECQSIRYALVTNRSLGARLCKCLDDHGGGLFRWKQGVDLKPTLGAMRLQVLAQMAFIIQTMEQWEERLYVFAHRYGAIDMEPERGINELTGLLARGTSTARLPSPITLRTMREVFAGSSEAVPLVPESARPHAREAVADFDISQIPRDSAPIWRREQDVLIDLARRFPVVVVTGTGGCGKTVGLWQWARDNVESPSGTGAFTGLRSARDLRPHWIHDLVWTWRNMPDRTDSLSTDTERAFERLQAANDKGERPILHLGIDGVDAHINVDAANRIKEIFDWLIEHRTRLGGEDGPVQSELEKGPPATLVVTCRTRGELENLLCLNLGYSSSETQFETVEFSVFDPPDLAEGGRMLVADGRLESDVVERLEASLRLHFAEAFDRAASVAPVLALASTADSWEDVRKDILDALRHPAMWRAFLGLDSREERVDVLNGSTEGLNRISEEYVNRFTHQTVQRQPHNFDNRQVTRDALATVALRTEPSTEQWFAKSDWIDAVRTIPDMSTYLALQLFHEAESGGIISAGVDSWCWLHKFVQSYLASDYR